MYILYTTCYRFNGVSGRAWDRAEGMGHAELVVLRWELVMSSRAFMSGMAEWKGVCVCVCTTG